MLNNNGYKPVTQEMICEICSQVISLKDTHSFVICYATPKTMQCPCEQHYGCNAEHALLAACACMMHHIATQSLNDPKLADFKEYLSGYILS